MDEEAKKTLLRSIPSGLYVIGVKAGDRLHGFTGSWVSQISMKPPAIILGVRDKSHSLGIIRDGRVISVNFFRKDQQELVATFFKAIDHEGDRLEKYSYHTGKTGAPLIDDAMGYLECEVTSIVDGFGDHAAVIAEVVDAEIKPDHKNNSPLIMSDTRWHYGG